MLCDQVTSGRDGSLSVPSGTRLISRAPLPRANTVQVRSWDAPAVVVQNSAQPRGGLTKPRPYIMSPRNVNLYVQ